LGETDRAIGLIDCFARCFTDSWSPELVEHKLATLVGQRIFGIALGYEDLLDHDDLRHDPIMAVLAGKLMARRKNCAPVAGKSMLNWLELGKPTLNRLELGKPAPTPYHKIGHDPQAIEALLVDLFVNAMSVRRGRSSSISMPPMTRCTGTRKGASSTAITTATATCRFTFFAAGICWRPNCVVPTSTPARARSRRSRASSATSAPAGRGCASCCALTPGLPANS
jgi:hypothetical protein